MQVSAMAPTIVIAPIQFQPDGPSGRSPSPNPSEATAPRMKNGPVKRQWIRPQREALTRHTAPMNASDAVHKTIFEVGDAQKPSAKTNHGTHQRRHALGPLHSRSRSGPHELASTDCMA